MQDEEKTLATLANQMMLLLGAIAFPIVAGVVGATPLPDDLRGIQQQLGRVLINLRQCPLRSDNDRLCATPAKVAMGQERPSFDLWSLTGSWSSTAISPRPMISVSNAAVIVLVMEPISNAVRSLIER